MRIYDISQEVFGCKVFPGDPKPKKDELLKISNGDICNLTAFYMCAHNGTHIDAPYHFLQNGKTVDSLSPEAFMGLAYVCVHDGLLGADDARKILNKAKHSDSRSAKRILIKGEATVTLEAAEVFAEAGILLLGNESQTVGPNDAPMAVHMALLGAEVVLLEGIKLKEVPEGVYFLSAAPLNLMGADGAPCRAMLVEM